MKFDIYNRATWNEHTVIDEETRLANRALGAMGQKIPEIRELKNKLNKNVSANNPEYDEAITLRDSHPAAFHQMAVYFETPNQSPMLVAIDAICDYWTATKTQDSKRARWREMVPHFEQLKPLLVEEFGQPYRFNQKIEDLVSSFTSVKVYGNEAWKLYYSTKMQLVKAWSKEDKHSEVEDDDIDIDVDVEDDRHSYNDEPSSRNRP